MPGERGVSGTLLLPGGGTCLSSTGDLHQSHCQGSTLGLQRLLRQQPSWEVEVPPFSLARGEDQVPTGPSLAWGRGAQFFQWCLAGVEQFSPESSLSWALFLILWLERTAFLGSTPSPTSPAPPPAGASPAAVFNSEIWSKAKTPGNHQDVIPWVLRCLLLFQSLTFLLHIIFKVFSFAKQEESGKTQLFHLYESRSLCPFLNLRCGRSRLTAYPLYLIV